MFSAVVHEITAPHSVASALATDGDREVEETWAGARPTTPDKAPIFGDTEWERVWVAGGYWRNGVLLSPILGKAMADKLSGKECDERWFEEFRWDRFLDPKQSRKMQIANRYMSEMHPVYYRSSRGIASSVGSEPESKLPSMVSGRMSLRVMMPTTCSRQSTTTRWRTPISLKRR